MMSAWQPLLAYWFGNEFLSSQALPPDWWPPASITRRWFNSRVKDDKQMATEFGGWVERALAGELGEWEASAESRLALILLLDQLPRNIYRRQAKAFSGDQRAAQLAQTGLATGLETALPVAAQVFFIMPLMHAEDLAQQRLAVSAFAALKCQLPAEHQARIATSLRFARDHQQIIQQFGRFPHRNAVLGRASSDQELAFLKTASRYGQ